MTTFPNSPRLRKGGLALVDPGTERVLRIVPLQYNPDSLTRSLQIHGASQDGGDRSEALRLTGPPSETIKLEAELDAADQREKAQSGQTLMQNSLHAQLAALETIVYPPSGRVRELLNLAAGGVMEIAPVEAPLTVFVWSSQRVLPVRITEFSVTEEEFDTELNPTRAKVSLSMRVLSYTDLGFDHKGARLFTVYHETKEASATLYRGGDLLTTFGIRNI